MHGIHRAVNQTPGTVFPAALFGSLDACQFVVVKFLDGNVHHSAGFFFKTAGVG